MNYQPIIIRINSRFCIFLPELNIKAIGNTIEEAYEQYEKKLQEENQLNADLDINALISEPYPTLKHKKLLHELAFFSVKVTISIFSFILVVVLLLPNISAAINHSIREAIPIELRDPRYWALKFPEQINARLERLKPEEQEQIGEQWAKLKERVQSLSGQTVACTNNKVKN